VVVKIKNIKNIFGFNPKIIMYFWDGHKFDVALILLLTTFSGFMEMLNVAVLLPLIQAGAVYLKGDGYVENAGMLDQVINWIMDLTGIESLMIAASLLVIIVSIINFGFKLLYTYYVQVKIEKIYLDVKSNVFRVLKNAHYTFYTSTEHGKLLHKASIAPDSILSGTDSLIRLVNQLVTIVFLLIMMALASPDILSVLIVAGIAYFLMSRKIVSWLVKEKSKEMMELRQEDMQLTGQFVNGIKPIRLYRAAGNWEKRYNRIADRYALLRRSVVMGFALPGALIQLLLGLGMGGAGFYLVVTSASVESIAILGVFVVAANRLNGAITATINYYSGLINQYPNINEVYMLLTTVDTEMPEIGDNNIVKFENNIEIRDVSFGYPQRKDKTLNNISLIIPKYKTIGVVGGSGGGKSTLLNILLRLFKPTKGQILLDGEPIENISLDKYWKLFGLVSQETFLINGSINDNILFGEMVDAEKIVEAAKMADVHNFINSLPNGYDTMVGENGVQLSGGQKQRIAIARALLRNPPVLILDEPTSALDVDTEKNIIQTINSLSGGRTIIIVAHRFSTIKDADQIVVMDDGEIVDVGSHETLMEKNSRYRRMYMANMAS